MRLVLPFNLLPDAAKAVVSTATAAMDGPFTLPFDLTLHAVGTVKRGASFVQSYPGTLSTLELVMAASAMSGAVRPVLEKVATDPLAARSMVQAMDAARLADAEALLERMRWATERTVAGKRSYDIQFAELL